MSRFDKIDYSVIELKARRAITSLTNPPYEKRDILLVQGVISEWQRAWDPTEELSKSNLFYSELLNTYLPKKQEFSEKLKLLGKAKKTLDNITEGETLNGESKDQIINLLEELVNYAPNNGAKLNQSTPNNLVLGIYKSL